jgi:TctA family transporter
MVSHQNDLTVFVTRPVSAIVLLMAAAMVVWPFVKTLRARRAAASRT